MAEMICKEEITGGIGLKYEYMPVQDLVRCKDCVRRGNPRECIVAQLTDKTNVPYFAIDNRGEWFCADGKKAGTE